MKIYVHTDNKQVSVWLEKLLDAIITRDPERAELIVFPGGDDVNPNMYNEPAGQHTSYNRHDNTWENIGARYFNKKKMLGICKGSQFLCALVGGKVIQHVTNHALFGTHDIKIGDKSYQVTSTHHQMMNPFLLNKDSYKILAHPEHNLSTVYLDGYDDSLPAPPVEPEAVLFNKGMLSVQFHPEFMSMDDPIQEVVKEWITILMNIKKEDMKQAEEEEFIPKQPDAEYFVGPLGSNWYIADTTIHYPTTTTTNS